MSSFGKPPFASIHKVERRSHTCGPVPAVLGWKGNWCHGFERAYVRCCRRHSTIPRRTPPSGQTTQFPPDAGARNIFPGRFRVATLMRLRLVSLRLDALSLNSTHAPSCGISTRPLQKSPSPHPLTCFHMGSAFLRGTHCLLGERGRLYAHRSSSDGSLIAASDHTGVLFWKRTSDRYVAGKKLQDKCRTRKSVEWEILRYHVIRHPNIVALTTGSDELATINF